MFALKLAPRWPRPSRKHLRPLVKVALPIGISGLLMIAYARIDGVLVYAIAGAHEAGLYTAIYNVLDQSHFVPISILTTLAPVLAAAWPHRPPAADAHLAHDRRAAVRRLLRGAGGARSSPPNRS